MVSSTAIGNDFAPSPVGLELDFVGYGVSNWNPTKLSNNCVSVVIAKHLQYENVHELWSDVYGQDLPDVPLQLWQIEDMIHRTGWEFRKNIFVSDQTGSAYSKMCHSCKPTTSGFIRAAAYVANGIGHVVVAEGPEFAARYICYQESTEGVDRTHEVKQADAIVIFYLKCPQYSPQFYGWIHRAYCTMHERRAKKDWKMELHILESLDSNTQDRLYEEIQQFEADLDNLVASSGLIEEAPHTS